jgi:hypothetical protein
VGNFFEISCDYIPLRIFKLVKVDFNNMEPMTNTIAIYCLNKKAFLICDFDGIKGVLSREEEVELCKTFGPNNSRAVCSCFKW